MRPLFRSLFVLSLFAMLAAHVSTGLFHEMVGDGGSSVVGLLDYWLRLLLVEPFGRAAAIYALLGLGAIFAVWAYVGAAMAARRGRGQTFSTW